MFTAHDSPFIPLTQPLITLLNYWGDRFQSLLSWSSNSFAEYLTISFGIHSSVFPNKGQLKVNIVWQWQQCWLFSALEFVFFSLSLKENIFISKAYNIIRFHYPLAYELRYVYLSTVIVLSLLGLKRSLLPIWIFRFQLSWDHSGKRFYLSPCRNTYNLIAAVFFA